MCTVSPAPTPPAALNAFAAVQWPRSERHRLERARATALREWEFALRWEQAMLGGRDPEAVREIDLFQILAPIGNRYIAADLALADFEASSARSFLD